jgi:hypothetical protein
MGRTAGNSKIFGIGLNKTGTTTLGLCGKILGYRSTSCDKGLLEDVTLRNDFTRVNATVGQFDLFEDWPWPLIYKELDLKFPGSKFVLTTRKNADVWLDSFKKHAIKTNPSGHCRKLAYGYNYPHRHEQEHLEFYQRHNDSVRTYFSGRDSDFIEICWENGDGFEKLCNFLGRDIPDIPLPHANKESNNRASKSILLRNRLLSIFRN